MAESSNGPVRLPEEVRAVNVGLPAFAEAVRAQGGEAVQVDWAIPAEGDPEAVRALTRLYGAEERYGPANAEVLRRLDSAAPVLVGVARAADVVPGMADRVVLHPGPPLPWEAFCDPLRRSVRATVMAEGWAASPEEAERLVAGGAVALEPANHHATVVPMAATLGPSASVLVVEDPVGGRRAFSGINQGPGRTPWFGVEAPEAVERLAFLRDVVGPILDRALRASPPVDVFSFAAQALLMGDDVHMRTQAATNLLIRHLLPALVEEPDARRAEVARFLSGNHLFFLNVAMAAAKAATAWAAEVEGSSIVTTMARNGTTFGIRVGADERWFVAPAPPVEDALFHPGYGPGDAAPDIGDSAVLELVGLGGAAAAASPAVAAFVGGRMSDAVERSEAVGRICAGRSSRFVLPALDFRGAPLGVDVRRVVELGITPAINTGILHVAAGTGQVGAGVARAPMACFREALLALPA
ncbi:MAG TPA: DUF1116 domain-containing protein [Actinomycetota bacterium]|nr:DUF1116 domain-containing protein [Actinomycetota bacterium]